MTRPRQALFSPTTSRAVVARRVLAAVGYLVLVAQVLLVAVRPDRYQWDFRSFYVGAHMALRGQDPYVPTALYAEIARTGFTDDNVLPFIYPPHALAGFVPLTVLPPVVALYVHLLVKVGCLGWIVVVGRRWVVAPWWRAALPLLTAVMFGGAVAADLRSGNVAILETALVLGSLEVLRVRRRATWSGPLLAAASFWKLALAPLVLLPLVLHVRSRVLGVVSGLVPLALLVAVDRIVRPDLWDSFLRASSVVTSGLEPGSVRGYLNASSFRLLADVSVLVFGTLSTTFVTVVGGVLVVTVVGTTAAVCLQCRRRAPVLDLAVLGVLGYALCVPRLTSYSYTLVVVPCVLVMATRARPVLARVLVTLSCVPFFYLGRLAGRSDGAAPSWLFLPADYANLMVVAMCWALLACSVWRTSSSREVSVAAGRMTGQGPAASRELAMSDRGAGADG